MEYNLKVRKAKQSLEDQKHKVIPSYRGSSRPVWVITDPVSKTKKKPKVPGVRMEFNRLVTLQGQSFGS